MQTSVAKTIIIVIDSLGAGGLPDSLDYEDDDVNCLTHVSEFVKKLNLPYLSSLGLSNITYIKGCERYFETQGFYGKIHPKSFGKEKLIAYWEMMGVYTEVKPVHYLDEVPEDVLHQFSQVTGQSFISAGFGSTLSILQDKFQLHKEMKKAIIHPAPDGSVHVTAHEDIISIRDLYQMCFKMRRTCDRNKIMRLVAKPCSGEKKPQILFDKEKVFAMPLPYPGVLDALNIRDISIYSVGKASDYFNDSGFLDAFHTNNYSESLEKAVSFLSERNSEREIILVEYNHNYYDMNIVNIDLVTSYGLFLETIDSFIPRFRKYITPNDILIIVGDQPNDIVKKDKVFTREYVPFIVFSDLFKPYDMGNLGIRKTFSDIGKTLAEMYGFEMPYTFGTSFWDKISSQF